MSSFVFISFHAFHFAFISSHVPFILHSFPFILHSFPFMLHSCPFILHSFPFIVLSCPFMSFHVPSLCIKDTGLRKLICSNRSGVHPPKRSRFVIIRYRFCYRLAIVLEACAGCHSGFMNMYMYKLVIVFFYSYRFLGRQCIGVPSQAKMKCPGKLYYPKWVALGRNQGSSFTRRLYRPFPVGIFQNFPYPTTKLCLRFDGLIIHPDHPGARRLRWAM